MKIVSIENGLEQTFWNHVDQNPLDYYLFILDMRQQRERTKITLAMEDQQVKGLMLVYADYIVQLRGAREAVKLLLDSLDLKKVELQAPLDCEDIVLGKYKTHAKLELVLMSLRKGEENIQISRSPTRLNVEDADEVAEIMRKADPEWWGEITAERQKESLEKTFWLGIRRDQRILSIGNTRFVDFGSNIGVIATDELYRNMGYATSIVSALIQEILKRSSVALIHVLNDNAPAKHVYMKVGFRPFRHYLLVRAEKNTG